MSFQHGRISLRSIHETFTNNFSIGHSGSSNDKKVSCLNFCETCTVNVGEDANKQLLATLEKQILNMRPKIAINLNGRKKLADITNTACKAENSNGKTSIDDTIKKFERSISLKGSKSEKRMVTHEKKSVRFADAFGLDLVSVKVIQNTEQPPLIPRNILHCLRKSALEVDRKWNVRNYYYDDSDAFDSDGESLEVPKIVPVSSQVDNFSGVNTFQVESSTFFWSVRFVQPGISADFFQRLNERKILLDSFYNRFAYLSGVVRVISLSFHKRVSIRFTFDNWNSFKTAPASYIENSFDGSTDRFTFELPVDGRFMLNELSEKLQLQQDERNTFTYNCGNVLCFTIQFAICYETLNNGCVTNAYWDNNCGANYTIECFAPNNAINAGSATINSTQLMFTSRSNPLIHDTTSAAFV